eukprot:m.204202 g.204202  ORF g.204202 m.204202 type:complete len:133 (+) comp10697_c0_seq16:454-852(+)
MLRQRSGLSCCQHWHSLTFSAGNIVNIASVVGLRGRVGLTAYSAAKAGLLGFSQSLAREVGSKGIRVNVVAPGFIDTAMTNSLPRATKDAILADVPSGQFGRPEHIAHAVTYLLDAEYVNGHCLVVDGGLSC